MHQDKEPGACSALGEQAGVARDPRDGLVEAFERGFLRQVHLRIRPLDVRDQLDATHLFLSSLTSPGLNGHQLRDELGWSLASLLGTSAEEAKAIQKCYGEFLSHWPVDGEQVLAPVRGTTGAPLVSAPSTSADRAESGKDEQRGDGDEAYQASRCSARAPEEKPVDTLKIGWKQLVAKHVTAKRIVRALHQGRPSQVLAVLILAVVLVASGLWLWERPTPLELTVSPTPAPSTPAPTPSSTPAPDDDPKVLADPSRPARALDPLGAVDSAPPSIPFWRWLTAFGILVLAARPWVTANAETRAKQTRAKAMRQRASLGEPVGNDELEPSVPPQPHVGDLALEEAATLLGRLHRVAGEGREIEVEATIRETLRRGIATPEMVDHREQRELLFLIDIEEIADHQGWPWLAGFEATLDRLEAHGVRLVRLYFSGDPGQIQCPSGPLEALGRTTTRWEGLVGRRYQFVGVKPFEQYARHYVGSPLIIFGRNLLVRFVNDRKSWEKWSRSLQPYWPLCAWIDPTFEEAEPSENMKRFRRALQEAQIARFPWTDRGLVSLAAYLTLEGHAVPAESARLPSYHELNHEQQKAVALWALASVQRPDARWNLLQYLRVHPDLPELSRELTCASHLHWLIQFAQKLQRGNSIDRGPRLKLSRIWPRLDVETRALLSSALASSTSEKEREKGWFDRFRLRMGMIREAVGNRRDFVSRVNAVLEARQQETLEALKGRPVPPLLMLHANMKMKLFRARQLQSPAAWREVTHYCSGPLLDETHDFLEWQAEADAERIPSAVTRWAQLAGGVREGGTLGDYFWYGPLPWLFALLLALPLTLLVGVVGWYAADMPWLVSYLPKQEQAPLGPVHMAPQDLRVEDPRLQAVYRPKLVPIPLPTDQLFSMGALDGDKDALDDEKPAHPVKLRQPYGLFETEVTQGQYTAVMQAMEGKAGTRQVVDAAPWEDQGEKTRPNHPAIYVDWYDAAEYANRLSLLEGLTPCYTGEPPGVRLVSLDCKGYRLPTEAEWEYAAQGGKKLRWAGTDDEQTLCEYANIGTCSGEAQLKEVRQGRMPNGYGLYDMSGNVWEWVRDWYDADYYKAPSAEDVGGPEKGDIRVSRGGTWGDYPQVARVSDRDGWFPDYRFDNLGFRLSRSLR